MVASGDVLLRFAEELPPFPEADVVALGMRVEPAIAQHFGVFFLSRGADNELAFMLQKPGEEDIRELGEEYAFLVDTGMWLLGERAVELLMARSGWDAGRGDFEGGRPRPYELYAGLGRALGSCPRARDPLVSGLRCAVVSMPEPEFYHLGSSRQLVEAVWALQNQGRQHTALALRAHPDQITQNSRVDPPIRQSANRTLWIENAVVPASWHLASEHVLTGVPENAWDLRLEPGVCLDFVPVRPEGFCVRVYGIDDPFRGAVPDAGTTWLGRPAAAWFAARGIALDEAGIAPDLDLQEAPLFPVVGEAALEPRFIEWLFQGAPRESPEPRALWLASLRLSAEQIRDRVDVAALLGRRAANRELALRTMYANRRTSVFHRLDLHETARIYAGSADPLPAEPPHSDEAPLDRTHEHMWRAAVRRNRGEPGEAEEAAAFACLREALVAPVRSAPVLPACGVLADQIVWGRSPVRLDLAGGWTDTPPYCLQHGGRVVNVAAELNGQPPIQVFARLSERPEIVVSSIDLGAEERVERYEQLAEYARPGSEFALAKAALALAGFLPEFHAEGGCGSLRAQMEAFGGGIEISLLAAVLQGSGLGTSSILAATLLGTLSELCALRWDAREVMRRTLAVEQLLTTGGGWQDQAGGVLRGVKHVATQPGVEQAMTFRWLPEHVFRAEGPSRCVLLYYTGLTRLAKGILQEIVRGMFLNAGDRLGILQAIARNADFAADAIQRGDWERVCEAVRRSWDLNRRLDAGTDPLEVRAVLEPVEDCLAACKLLGAGGGGYLLMLAKDEEAAARVRRILTERPPNARARFVDVRVSQTGLEVTKS